MKATLDADLKVCIGVCLCAHFCVYECMQLAFNFAWHCLRGAKGFDFPREASRLNNLTRASFYLCKHTHINTSESRSDGEKLKSARHCSPTLISSIFAYVLEKYNIYIISQEKKVA